MNILNLRSVAATAVLFVSPLLAGCGDEGDAKSNEHAQNGGGFFPGMHTGLQDAAGGPQGAGPQPGAAPVNPATGNPAVSQPPIAATQDNTGRKGRAYGGGIITQPISSYFRAQDRIKLDVLQYDLKLYQAEHGNYPRSHEEFVAEILEPGQRIMPEAEDPNYEVRYSPETGWLILVPKGEAQ